MKYLIIGGAGFIGINAAEHFLKKGDKVTILDNLSRDNVDKNLSWIQENYSHVNFVKADITKNQDILNEEVKKVDAVIHLAAQVAVTTSVVNPREDFEINALGTFNVCEAVRISENKPILLYSSTNKVYGKMTDVEVEEINNKYQYKNQVNGISEQQQLDFHSPYGCSKGVADQYVKDYSRIYGLKTIIFRQSCIYGYRQFGVEDQGWVAWFTIATCLEKGITIYGDGKQVRDVLFIEDLVRAYDLAIKNINITNGNAYNMGGGPNNQMSLIELISYLEEFFNRKIELGYNDWRPGDQKIFVCNIEKAKKDFGWEPKTSPKEGVFKLSKWVNDNKILFE